MHNGRRWVVGLFTASLLLAVPASALHRAFAQTGRLTARQAGSSATDVIFHQNEERRTYVGFARTLRSQFRRSGPFLRASTNRYLRDLLLDLRAHWRVERRTGVVSSFDFPDL
jgi:hypothetical protein